MQYTISTIVGHKVHFISFHLPYFASTTPFCKLNWSWLQNPKQTTRNREVNMPLFLSQHFAIEKIVFSSLVRKKRSRLIGYIRIALQMTNIEFCGHELWKKVILRVWSLMSEQSKGIKFHTLNIKILFSSCTIYYSLACLHQEVFLIRLLFCALNDLLIKVNFRFFHSDLQLHSCKMHLPSN